MTALANLISTLITLYLYLVIAYVAMTWLINFQIVSRHNQMMNSIFNTLSKLVEPALKPIKQLLSRVGLGNLGGVDISPVILILLLVFVSDFVSHDLIGR